MTEKTAARDGLRPGAGPAGLLAGREGRDHGREPLAGRVKRRAPGYRFEG